MKKLICPFYKRAGMSADDFKTYYETRHVTLLMKLIPRFSSYRRSFVTPAGNIQIPGLPTVTAPDFDVINEPWFADKAYEGLVSDLGVPDIGNAIAADEENFFDRKRMVIHEMEDRVTPSPDLGAGTGAKDDGSMPKIMCMHKAKAGVPQTDLIQKYEAGLAPLTAKLLPMLSRYRRSYVVPSSAVKFAHIADVPPGPDFGVMTELWTKTLADQKALIAEMSKPDVAKKLSDEMAKVFDASGSFMFTADERVTPLETLSSSAEAKGYRWTAPDGV